jgi:hypothetical protein
LGVQHEFSGNNFLSVSYVGNLGRHLARARNINDVPIGTTTQNVQVVNAATGALEPLPDPSCDASGNCDVQNILMNNRYPAAFFAPYRGYSTVNQKEYSAVSSYSSLQTDFRHTVGHGLTVGAAYTWSHVIDDSTSAWEYQDVDDFNLSRWKATSDINRTQILELNYVYDLPFARHASSSFVRGAIGGWQLSGISSFFTGFPLNVFCGVNGFSSGIGESVRCNSVGPLKIQKGVTDDPQYGPTATWFNPNAFAQPLESQLYANGQSGMFGYMGRNTLTGPGRNNWDLALHKEFKMHWLGEAGALQVRWETFNTFNHTQWNGVNIGCSGSPNNDGSAAFGRPCGGSTYNLGNGEVNSTWSPRVMSFALKLVF